MFLTQPSTFPWDLTITLMLAGGLAIVILCTAFLRRKPRTQRRSRFPVGLLRLLALGCMLTVAYGSRPSSNSAIGLHDARAASTHSKAGENARAESSTRPVDTVVACAIPSDEMPIVGSPHCRSRDGIRVRIPAASIVALPASSLSNDTKRSGPTVAVAYA